MPVFARDQSLAIPTVLSPVSLEYQGHFWSHDFALTNLPGEWFANVLEFYGSMNFLKAGIACADSVVLPGALLLGPGFETLFHLGLVDTYVGVLLPALAPAFGIYLFRQAMINSVPEDILESARLDGCGEFRIFFQIVLPLVRPMISAYLIIVFIATWNSFIHPQIVLQSPERHPLAVAIFSLRGLYGDDYSLIMAGTLVSIAPVMVLFLMLQKEFISGLTSGAVKG